jgi:large subunit ribosomal protein L4e
VARIPRVSGGGTSRSGQGAFGNMCRKGRMFAPTKTWRRWHRSVNTNQKRFAVASALAASALPGLVFARGHAISQVPEVPLVLDNGLESINKTKAAIAALRTVGAYADVEKVKGSRKLRRGVGKMRNRRHTQRRGPLIVYAQDNGIVRAFRNLPGVELASVNSLNLLQLAPGGHLGRFVIWTRDAFNALNANWGSFNRLSTQKSGYHLPRPLMTNSDLTRIINSDEIQSKVRPSIKKIVRHVQHKNPLTNLGARIKLNPYAAVIRRAELLAAERRAAGKAAKVDANRTKHLANQKSADKTHRTTQQAVNYNRLTIDNYVAPKRQPKAASNKATKPAAKAAAKK